MPQSFFIYFCVAAVTAVSVICQAATSRAEVMMRQERERGMDGGMSRTGRTMQGIGIGIGVGRIIGNTIQQQDQPVSNEPRSAGQPPKKRRSDDPKRPKQARTPPEKPPLRKTPDGNGPSVPGPRDAGRPGDPPPGGKPAMPLQTVDSTKNCCSCPTEMRLTVTAADYGREAAGPAEKYDANEKPDDVGIDEKKAPSILVMHRFFLKIKFTTIESPVHGPLTLEWWEKSDRPPPIPAAAGFGAGQPYENEQVRKSQNLISKKGHRPSKPGDDAKDQETIQAYVEAHKDGTMMHWQDRYLDNAAHVCTAQKKNGEMQIDDAPGARTPRRLDFHFVVRADPRCGCPKPKLELFAAQILRRGKRDVVGSPIDMTTNDGVSGMFGPGGQIRAGHSAEGTEPPAKEAKIPEKFLR